MLISGAVSWVLDGIESRKTEKSLKRSSKGQSSNFKSSNFVDRSCSSTIGDSFWVWTSWTLIGCAALTPSFPLKKERRRWKTFQRFISAFEIPNCFTRTTCVSKLSVRVKVKGSSSNHSWLKTVQRFASCSVGQKMLFSSKLLQPSWIVRTKKTVEWFSDLSTSMDSGILWLPKRVLCKFDVIFGACATRYCWIIPNRVTRVFTKASHSGKPVKILSLEGCSSQNLVILTKWESSGSPLDIENPAQAHSVLYTGFRLGKCSPEFVAGTWNCWIVLFSSKFQSLRGVQNLWPLPAIFLNRGICLVCTQEGLLGPFG